jgi:iron complex outermembrane receptor protein
MSFTDMQVSSTVVDPVTKQGTVRNTNAGGATIDGIEVEGTYLVGDAGTLTFGGSLLSATYDEFDTTETSYGSTQGQQWNPCALGKNAGGACNGVGPGGTGDGLYDLSGNSLPYAPELSFSLGYKHEIALDSGASIVPRFNYAYSGEYFFDAFNRGDRAAKTIDATDPGAKSITKQDAYGKLNLGITYNAPDGQWSSDFFIDNATNEAIKQSQGSRTGNDYAYNWNDEKSYGLRLNYKFK